MLNFVSSQDVTIEIPFLTDGTQEPFIPVVNSASYRVLGHDGTPIVSPTALTLGATDTRTAITIAANLNTITSERFFEKRFLIVSASANGKPWQRTIPYRITPLPLYTVTVETVRNFCGITEDEVPDEAIDVFSGYLSAREKLGATQTTAALISGTRNEILANNAILGYTVIGIIPSLRLAISFDRTDGSIAHKRSEIDIEDLERRARQLIDDAATAILQRVEAAYPMFAFPTIVDVITGV